jgi:hypothetical protein
LTDPTVAAWDLVLAALETRLERIRAAVEAAEDPGLEPFEPPDLPPMPAAVAERAQRLLERTQAVEQLMVERRDALGRAVASLPRRRPGEDAGGARYVDRAC